MDNKNILLAICDDNEQDQQKLQKICKNLGYQNILFFLSGKQLLTYPELKEIDLIFFDVEMPSLNGLQIRDALEFSAPETSIVFLTGYEKYMPEAFGKNVRSFVSKPCTESQIDLCIKKVIQASTYFHPVILNENLCVPSGKILYFQSENKTTFAYLTTGEKKACMLSIKEYLQKLESEGFFEIRRGLLINIRHATTVCSGKIRIKDKIFTISFRSRKRYKETESEYRLSHISF